MTTTSTGRHGPRGRPRGTHAGCRCTCGLVEGGVPVTRRYLPAGTPRPPGSPPVSAPLLLWTSPNQFRVSLVSEARNRSPCGKATWTGRAQVRPRRTRHSSGGFCRGLGPHTEAQVSEKAHLFRSLEGTARTPGPLPQTFGHRKQPSGVQGEISKKVSMLFWAADMIRVGSEKGLFWTGRYSTRWPVREAGWLWRSGVLSTHQEMGSAGARPL